MSDFAQELAEAMRRIARREARRKHSHKQPTAEHDPEDTRTPPAPGAIQIGPLDVS